MRVGGKIHTKRRTGDPVADRILHEYYAAKDIDKKRATDPQWQMAAACASNRRLLIGNSKVFRSPR